MKTTKNNDYVVSVINAAEFQKTVPMHPQTFSVNKAEDYVCGTMILLTR